MIGRESEGESESERERDGGKNYAEEGCAFIDGSTGQFTQLDKKISI